MDDEVEEAFGQDISPALLDGVQGEEYDCGDEPDDEDSQEPGDDQEEFDDVDEEEEQKTAEKSKLSTAATDEQNLFKLKLQ